MVLLLHLYVKKLNNTAHDHFRTRVTNEQPRIRAKIKYRCRTMFDDDICQMLAKSRRLHRHSKSFQ